VDELLNTSKMVVRFQVDDPSRAVKLIEKDFHSVQGVSTDNRELEFEIEKMEIADVAESFVKNGLRIYGIEQKRKLEDYFIKMIAEV
jgi:hypothetical protein